MAGRPDSFFRRESILEWADDFNVSVVEWDDDRQFDQSYLAAAHQEGKAGTPVFGMRLMWESVADLSKRLESFYPGLPSDSARFRSAFGSPRYLHLAREDKVAQAVSLLKAEQSGLWHVFADGTERERLGPGQAPAYDSNELLELVSQLKEDDAAWTRWFDQQEVEPVCISYEALSTEPQAVLATVLSFLGLDPDIAGDVKPRTAKLADSESCNWAARFRKESARHETSR
jgi:LPS sulfotransferase NodH